FRSPSRSASSVTGSSGACISSSSVLTPTALPAIILRSLSLLFSRATSSAPHIIYPLSDDIDNSDVLGSFTSVPIPVAPLGKENGIILIICCSPHIECYILIHDMHKQSDCVPVFTMSVIQIAFYKRKRMSFFRMTPFLVYLFLI